ncbi:MAG: hypothetical protein LBR11_03095 [Deltaproteobacteria bacterium]|nr:hypothetical protein [Deltaproteobacteria bacterium]
MAGAADLVWGPCKGQPSFLITASGLIAAQASLTLLSHPNVGRRQPGRLRGGAKVMGSTASRSPFRSSAREEGQPQASSPRVGRSG